MREAPKKKMSPAEVAVMAACDPWFCVLLAFGKSWKAGLILLALIAIAVIMTGFLILRIKRWEI